MTAASMMLIQKMGTVRCRNQGSVGSGMVAPSAFTKSATASSDFTAMVRPNDEANSASTVVTPPDPCHDQQRDGVPGDPAEAEYHLADEAHSDRWFERLERDRPQDEEGKCQAAYGHDDAGYMHPTLSGSTARFLLTRRRPLRLQASMANSGR